MLGTSTARLPLAKFGRISAALLLGATGALVGGSAPVNASSTLTPSPCTAASLSPSPSSPQVTGTTVLWTASATGCGSPQFRFFVASGSVGWAVAQDWSASPTFRWNTSGLAADSYLVEAWARSGTSGGFEAVSPDVPYTLNVGTPSPSSSCADEAQTLGLQAQRVDGAFSDFRNNLMTLRGQRAPATIEQADRLLRFIRKAAVQAIHATASQACTRHDDDENQGENEDGSATMPTATTLSLVGERWNDEADDGDRDGRTKPTPVTFTGDATSIADQAIAAMQVAFNTAQSAPAATPMPTPTTRHPDQHDGKGDHGD